ncbi:MAG TPA: AAA family ATPase [Thermoanaerobaculia bacterium]|nr:AAA family ATPase [Thermoanaerobaculia bacterium]
MKIEAIQVKNYRALRHVSLTDLPSLCVFIGANGTGKSTLFDVFGFLHDSLIHNVRQALATRGGFHEVVSRDQEGPIEIELKLREKDGPLVTYQLAVGLSDGSPVIEREVLKYRRGQHGQPWRFLDFRRGKGLAVTNEADYGKPDAEMVREEQELESPDILAVKGLGQFQRFKQVSAFRRLIEDWHVSDFHINDARPSQEAGHAEHLSERGDNLPLVAQYMFEQHRSEFQEVLEKMKRRVPGVSQVDAVETVDGRIALRFQDGSFKDPFLARFVSDGTIKMFAYLLMLHDPKPHPLLCVEEPENQLHPDLLRELAEEFREYAERGGQVFISTHSPDFLNGAELAEIFWLTKKGGYTDIQRAVADPVLAGLVREGDLPGALWKQGLLGGIGLH